MKISIIVPCFNEEKNIEPFYNHLVSSLRQLHNVRQFEEEIIFVNDGSTDQTLNELMKFCGKDIKCKIIDFRKNYGQTAAMAAGFDLAVGDIIIPMDADLQNDPDDIGALLNKIDEGFDVVSGWRKNRKDKAISRKLPSKIANWLISLISRVRLNDYGCTLKAYKKNILKNLRLYGEMHRFIPIYAYWLGAKITEIPVNHHPRIHGKSKYGIIRTFKVILDLITIKFLGDFSTKPLYLFGSVGFVLFFIGLLCEFEVAYVKFVLDQKVYDNPMLIIGVFFMVIGFQSLLIGLLAEINIRTYHESQNRPIYWIQNIYQ